MKSIMILAVLLCIGTAEVTAQSYRSTVNEGNEHYTQQEYDRAREKYEQAAANEPDRIESYFNAGNAAYRAAAENASAEDIQAALQAYEKAGARIENKAQLAQTFYNAGNTFLQAADKGLENPLLQQAAAGKNADMRMQGYLHAIDMYKRTLKLDPGDADARYNLTYAKKKLQELKQQQQQNQDQDQKKDQKEDKQQDEQQKDQSKDEDQQKKDQQNQDQQQQQNQKDQDQKDDARKNQQQQSKPEQEQKMSKQQAEQILRALEREEKALQKKKRMKVNARANVEKDW